MDGAAQRPRRQLRALIEFLIMCTAIVAVGLAFNPSAPLFMDLRPHPIWIPIVLIAVRFGSPAGFLCGALAGVGYVAVDILVIGDDIRMTFHLDIHRLVEPLLFILAGSFIGESVESMSRRADFFRDQLASLRRRNERVEAHSRDLEAAYRQVEGRLAGMQSTVIALYDSLKTFETATGEAVIDNLTATISRFMEASDIVVYRRGRDDDFERIDAIDEAPPGLVLLAAERRDIVTVHDWRGDGEPGAVLAGPLGPRTPMAQWIVAIRRIRFSGFTESTVKMFDLLLDAAGRHLERASGVDPISGKRMAIAAPMGQALFDHHQLHLVGVEQLCEAAEQHVRVGVVSGRIGNRCDLQTGKRLVEVVALVFRHVRKAQSHIFHLGDGNGWIAIMPQVDEAELDDIVDHWRRHIDTSGLRVGPRQEALCLYWHAQVVDGEVDIVTLIDDMRRPLEDVV